MTNSVVLCYHAVVDGWRADLAISPSAFEDQIRFLHDRGYRGVTFHEAVTAPAVSRTVAVTFDDGFHSVLDFAFPILQRFGFPATIFVVTRFVGTADPLEWAGIDHWRDTENAADLAAVSWAELRQLADLGWEIGSHTCTHPHLPLCVEDELAWELLESKRRCEDELGVPCRSLAYPYGEVDARVARAAGSAGYVTAAGLPGCLRHPSPLVWPRIGIYNRENLSRFRLKVSPVFRRFQGSPVWPAVEAAARSLQRSSDV
jgi:peptidoglycan/xylan/chitin deacetylase (PgdA/CDA1 family)